MDVLGGKIVIEPAGQEGWAFVLATWLATYSQSVFAVGIPGGVFDHFHRQIATRLLQVGDLRLAKTREDGLFLGWRLCSPPGVLQYVYVKQPFQRMGIGRMLVADLPRGFIHTHRTKQWMGFCRKLGLVTTYNPYLI
jgi:GNAT superfamily N-acetyltransferase